MKSMTFIFPADLIFYIHRTSLVMTSGLFAVLVGCKTEVSDQNADARKDLASLSSRTQGPDISSYALDDSPPTLGPVTASAVPNKCQQIRIDVVAFDNKVGLQRKAYSFNGGISWQADPAIIIETSTLDLKENSVQVRDQLGNVVKYNHKLHAVSTGCTCVTPWGKELQDGESVTGYKISHAAQTKDCDSTANSGPLKCLGGYLSGDPSFQYGSCQPEVVNDSGGGTEWECDLPWRGHVTNGSMVLAYSRLKVSCAESCQTYKQNLVCDYFDGLLKDPNGKLHPESIYPECIEECL